MLPTPAVEAPFKEPPGRVATTTVVTTVAADSTAAAPQSHHSIEASRRALLCACRAAAAVGGGGVVSASATLPVNAAAKTSARLVIPSPGRRATASTTRSPMLRAFEPPVRSVHSDGRCRERAEARRTGDGAERNREREKRVA